MAKRATERAKKRDDHVWDTDCVEIFLDRTGDTTKFIHIGVSSIGVRYDARKDIGAKWNPEYDVATLLDDESWSAELRIPFESLGGVPKPGETWRMNFARERYTEGLERGIWSVTFGSFHTPDRLGFVQFE